MATDAELNEYMGVKKYAPYRKDLKWDPHRNDKLKELKGKIAERTGVADVAALSNDNRPVKKRKGKKERMRSKLEVGGDVDIDEEPVAPTEKRKRPVEEDEEDDRALTEATKKKKRRHKKKAEDEIAT